MLGTGLFLYMLSKEIYVINHETFAAASIGAVVIYGIKKFGPSVAAFADKLNEVCIVFCIQQKLPNCHFSAIGLSGSIYKVGVFVLEETFHSS